MGKSLPTAIDVPEVLSRRALSRSTLARQLLLERSSLTALEAIGHLGGMQSQAPLAPYVGLWSRLRNFEPVELSRLTEERQVVRLHLMRNTVHLASSRDALEWRPLFMTLQAADFGAHFPRGLDSVDRPALLAEARRLLGERPRTRAELGRLLGERWPRAEPTTLAYLVTHHLALCQVPPRGLWGHTGSASWAVLEDWLGAELRPPPVDALVLRYLGAFGPASVADVQVWSGLARLGEVVERLPLLTFVGEDGQVLYDLPGAPRPPADTPAPPRFLPEYDNLLLSYRDRTRVNPDRRPVPLPPGNGAVMGTFLLDGVWQGTWRTRDRQLVLQPFVSLRTADRGALLSEASRLATFLGLGADDVGIVDP